MPRSPFVVQLAEVLAVPGRQHELVLAGTLPGIGLSTSRVPDDAVVALTATIEAQGQQVIVQGVVAAPWEGDCRRCLDPVGGELAVELREVFEPNPVDGETYPTDGETVDLQPVLRDVLALALPLAPLCREDCPGPDPEDHPVLAEEDDGEAPSDPRWAALDQLRFDR
jgi:uncharacterized protein